MSGRSRLPLASKGGSGTPASAADAAGGSAPVGQATPLVRKLAAQWGVDLAAVSGTGTGGRITKADVQRAAGPAAHPAPVQTWRPPSVAAAVAASSSRIVEVRSVWEPTVTVRVDDFARNPYVDDLRQAQPNVYAQAVSREAPPALFLGGDLPAFLASGQNPNSLLALPWDLRHGAASADMSDFAALVDAAAGSDHPLRSGAMTAGDMPMIQLLSRCRAHPGNRSYRARVDAWRSPRWEPATAGLATNVQLPKASGSGQT